LGKPSRLACHEAPTVPQDRTVLMSQLRLANGFYARATPSVERTREAPRPMTDDTSISM
jgi:hypothetical protein